MELLKTEREVSETDEAYIQEKCRKVEELIPEIDALINEQTTGWKTGRMNKADLTILRLAVYEMKWDEDIPVKVAINEAVELAKKYSSDEDRLSSMAFWQRSRRKRRWEMYIRSVRSTSTLKICSSRTFC